MTQRPVARARLEIESTLVLSTGHVTKETADSLNGDIEPERGWSPHFQNEYGWIFWADQDLQLVPEEFEAIFALAKSVGCKWVRFDCDGPRVPTLPFFTW